MGGEDTSKMSSPVKAWYMAQRQAILEGMKNMTVLENTVALKSTLAENQIGALEALADTLASQIVE